MCWMYLSFLVEFMSTEMTTSKNRAKCSGEAFLAIYTTSISRIRSIFSLSNSIKLLILVSIFFRLLTFDIHLPLFTSNYDIESVNASESINIWAKGIPSEKSRRVTVPRYSIYLNFKENFSIAWHISALFIFCFVIIANQLNYAGLNKNRKINDTLLMHLLIRRK